MFIEDSKGDLYPLSKIARISRPRTDQEDGGLLHVEFDGGGRARVYEHQVDKLRQQGTIVPANEGFYVIHANTAEEGDVWRTPVIAWAIDGSGNSAPVTPDGIDDGVDVPVHILTPEGLVISPGDQAWPSLESFLAEKFANGEKAEA